MNAARKKELWEGRRFPSYQGEEPFVYLSYAGYELEEGLLTLRVLNEAGCRVRYDEELFVGRPWTSGICDAIEDCSVFFEVNRSGDDGFSLTKKLASSFASLLDKKTVTVYFRPSVTDDRPEMPSFFRSALSDPAYPDKCREALDAAGYFSAVREPRGEESRCDLAFSYYADRSGRDRRFGGLLPRHCNPRTHDSWGYRSACPLSDEQVYCAVRWTSEKFYLRERSADQDYKPRPGDRAFTDKIRQLDGKAPEELIREFSPESLRTPEPHPPFPAGYPYKDEFDYLGSDDDEL